MALLEVLFVKLAETLVKFAVEAGTGSKMAGELGAGATSAVGGRVAGLADNRRARLAVDRLAGHLADELVGRYGHEYRELSDADRAAAVQAVIDTFDAGGIGPGLVAGSDGDPRRLADTLRRESRDLLGRAALGRDGEEFYGRLLRDACVQFVAVVARCPEFLVAAETETLSRLRILGDDLSREFARIHARLDPLVEARSAVGGVPAVHEVEKRLALLPPAHHGRLRQWVQDAPESWQVLTALTSADEEPVAVVRDWEADPPAWLSTAPVACRLAAATLAAAYDGTALAAGLFTSAARDGAPRKQFWLARAALTHFDDDRPDEGRTLMTDLAAKGTLTDPFARALAAFLEEDRPGLRRELAAWSPHDPLEIALHYSLSTREIASGQGEDRLSREALDEVIALSKGVLDSVWIGTVALAHSHHLVMRVERGEAVHRHTDLKEALQLALRARDERRSWRADSAEAAALACQAAHAARDFRAVLTLGLVGPQGATPAEAASPQVRKFVVLARTWLGDPPDDVTVDDMGEPHLVSAMKAFIALQRGEDPVPHWREVAETAPDDGNLAYALLNLARCGQLDLPRLVELAERAPDMAREVEAASDVATGNSSRGVAVLRVLARTSQSAAAMLAEVHSHNGDIDALVGVLRQAAEDFSDPQPRLDAAFALHRASRNEDADQELSTLLATAPRDWQGIREARRLAAQIAFEEGRLEQAIDLLRTAVSTDPEHTSTRWALIDLLFRRAETPMAWRVYREHRGGLEPTVPREAHLWIDLHRQFGDPMVTLRGSLELAHRFPDSEPVVAHVLTTLLMLPRLETPVPTDLAERWHETAEEFFRRWPDSRWLRRIDAADIERAVEELNTSARIAPELRRAQRDAFAKAVLGQAPIGAWAQLTSHHYSEVVLRRGGGVLSAAHPDRGEQRLCETTTLSAVEDTVVIDTTAIVVLNTLPPTVRDLALGLFGVVMTTDLVLQDARATDELLSRRSTARWQWNEEAQTGGPVEAPQEQADQLAEEAAHLVVAVERLVRRPRPSARVAGDRDDRFYLPWMPVLDLAAAQQRPVWADDTGLRNLARQLGVPAISTSAVLGVLLVRSLITPQEHAHAIETMFRARVGDFVLTDQQFLDAARAEDWSVDGAAAVALGRPAAWQDPAISLRRMRSLMRAVQKHRPDLLHWWLYWCVRGTAFTMLADPRRACGMAGGLLAITLHEMAVEGPAVRLHVDVCRIALAEVFPDLGQALDPLPVTSTLLFNIYADEVPGGIALQYLRGVMADLDEVDQRMVLRTILERPQ